MKLTRQQATGALFRSTGDGDQMLRTIRRLRHDVEVSGCATGDAMFVLRRRAHGRYRPSTIDVEMAEQLFEQWMAEVKSLFEGSSRRRTPAGVHGGEKLISVDETIIGRGRKRVHTVASEENSGQTIEKTVRNGRRVEYRYATVHRSRVNTSASRRIRPRVG